MWWGHQVLTLEGSLKLKVKNICILISIQMSSTGKHGFIAESRAYSDFTKEPWYPGFLRMIAKKGILTLPKGKSHENLNRNRGVINSTSTPSLLILPPLCQHGEQQVRKADCVKDDERMNDVMSDDENKDVNDGGEVNKRMNNIYLALPPTHSTTHSTTHTHSHAHKHHHPTSLTNSLSNSLTNSP